MDSIAEIRWTDIETKGTAVIIEILVNTGMMLDEGQPLLILKSEDNEIEFRSPVSGKVGQIHIGIGDQLSGNDLILTLASNSQYPNHNSSEESTPSQIPSKQHNSNSVPIRAELVVIGGGPGGYTAAFRAADLGIKTVLIERHSKLGGVCLNVGCIPSKALLHLAKIIDEASLAEAWGLKYPKPELDLEGIHSWKSGVVSRLNTGLSSLGKKRGIKILKGSASFISPNSLEIKESDTTSEVHFDNAIIATGSSPNQLPGLPGDPRIINSTKALTLKSIPRRFLIIGGGVIGMELATAYHAFGSEITIIETTDHLIASADSDLVRPLEDYVRSRFKEVYLNTNLLSLKPTKKGIIAEYSRGDIREQAEFDQVLVAIGRRPNSKNLALDKAGIVIDEQGFIGVDKQQRTNLEHIFAIGDVTGNPMLAHKAAYEGKIAAEAAAGQNSSKNTRVIPFVAYTDPEVAWVGKTETELKAEEIPYEKSVFPWVASGRSLTMGRSEGMTKLLFDPASGEILGAGIVGANASELIAQMGLSIETGCSAKELTQTVHPHPTLSESLSMAAEIFEGTVTDLFIPKSKRTTQQN